MKKERKEKIKKRRKMEGNKMSGKKKGKHVN